MGGRRNNGEGSLRPVAGRNLYQYRWTEWVDQEAVRRVDYAKTRALAVTELRRATTRAAAGRVGADSTAPLRVVANRWESRAGVAQRLAPSTVKAYSGVLHRHVLPVIGDISMREVRPSQVVDVLVIMDRSGLGPASQGHALQALRAVGCVNLNWPQGDGVGSSQRCNTDGAIRVAIRAAGVNRPGFDGGSQSWEG